MPSRRTLAFLFAVLLTVYSLGWMYLIRQQSAVVLGIHTVYRPSAERLVLRDVRRDGPGAQAGLRQDDEIVAIDGEPLTRPDPYYRLRRTGRPGQEVRLTIERNGVTEVVPLTLAPRRATDRDFAMPSSLVPQAVQSLIQQILGLYPLPFLLVAVVVLLQRPDDPHAWLLALMLAGFITAAPASELEFQVPAFLRGPMFAFWSLLSSLLPAIFYFFFSVFPTNSPLDRRVPWLKHVALWGALAIAAPLSFMVLAAGGLYGLWAIVERLGDWTSRWLILYGIYAFGLCVLGLVSLGLNAFGEPDVRRKSRVILLGMLVAMLPLVVVQIVSIVFRLPPYELPFAVWAGMIFALFAIPVSLGYAVVKHRAMEIPVLLRRSARYFLVRRGLETLAIAAGLVMTWAFARVVDSVLSLPADQRTTAGLLAGSVFGGVLALAGRRAWQPAATRLDKAFFRGSYDARRLLEILAEQSRGATDRDGLAELIDHAIVQALHPKSLTIYLRGGDDWTFEAAAHEGLDGAAARLPASPSQLVDLTKRGRPVLIDPVRLDPLGAWGSFAPLQPEALVPLVGRSGQLEGLLVLGPRLSEEPYSGEDVSMLASVGTQAGLALENIRLAQSMATRLEVERRVARELEIARDVQAQLLPQTRPQLASLDLAGTCLQARIVGGDYFDFVKVGPQQLGLVLADISGKGISAALLMASLQANLRAQYAYAVNDLARVLCAVNQIFYDSTAANHYATLFFGLYDEETRRLRYANCGHLPPVVRRADGRIERLSVTAPVVGLFEPWECEVADTDLGPGDLFVVFTDGLSEATSDDDEEFGEERLLELLIRHRDADAATVMERIVDAVRIHSGSAQYDDLTLIVAKGR